MLCTPSHIVHVYIHSDILHGCQWNVYLFKIHHEGPLFDTLYWLCSSGGTCTQSWSSSNWYIATM